MGGMFKFQTNPLFSNLNCSTICIFQNQLPHWPQTNSHCVWIFKVFKCFKSLHFVSNEQNVNLMWFVFQFAPRFHVFQHLYFHLAVWGHSNGNLRVNPNLLPSRWQKGRKENSQRSWRNPNVTEREREEEADLHQKWESARLREVGGVGTHTDQQSCHILYKALSSFLSYRPIIAFLFSRPMENCFPYVGLTIVITHLGVQQHCQTWCDWFIYKHLRTLIISKDILKILFMVVMMVRMRKKSYYFSGRKPFDWDVY